MDKIKEKRKKQILDAAMKVFVGNGFENSRMDDIVHRSGLSKGAIYHHYSSKKELFLELIDVWEVQTFPRFYSKSEDGKTATEIINEFSEEVVRVFKNKRYLFLAEIEFWAMANRDKDVQVKSNELYNKILHLFVLVFNKGIRDEEFIEFDTKAYAVILLTLLNGINWFSIFNSDDVDVETYIKLSIELFLAQIRAGER
tara:strand:+ start:165 stop:761 length:597 start_codon:yes stop_codon:yes gene_type:complete